MALTRAWYFRKNCWHAHCVKYYQERKSRGFGQLTMRLLESNKIFFWSITLLTEKVAVCFSYNLYTPFFPMNLNIR
jgi:hypothetical protein